MEFYNAKGLIIRTALTSDIRDVAHIMHRMWVLNEGKPWDPCSNEETLNEGLIKSTVAINSGMVIIVAIYNDKVAGMILCHTAEGVGSISCLYVAPGSPRSTALRLLQASGTLLKERGIEDIQASFPYGDVIRNTYLDMGFEPKFETHCTTVSSVIKAMESRLKCPG